MGADTRDVAKFGARIVGSPSRTDRFGPLMQQFTLDRVVGEDPEALWRWVEGFGVPYQEWFDSWRGNRSNFLDVLCWGHDHDFGSGRAKKGTMDDRHVTNLERVVAPGGLDPDQHVRGRRCLVVGAYCGGEVLLLHALGAERVDAVEEVPEYAAATARLAAAFGVRQRTWACSLYEVVSGSGREALDAVDALGLQGRSTIPAPGGYDLVYCPGVVYHLTDQVAALRILRDLARPGGTVAFETGVAGQQDHAVYQGASKPGWNWWVCGPGTYLAMMRDVGIGGGRQVEQVGGRAWFVGVRVDADPLRENGCAGFSLPHLLGRRRGYRQGG